MGTLGTEGFSVKLSESPQQKRNWPARAFTAVEDMVYLGLGVLLAGCSVALLVSGVINLAKT